MWLAILLFLGFLIALERYNIWRLKSLMPNIPIASRVPLLGSTVALASVRPDNTQQKFQEYTKRFGKSFYARPFGVIFLVTSDYRYIEQILQSQRHLRKSHLYEALSSWLGNGLLISYGSHWQTMRKIITPTFHFKILEEFVDVFDRQSTTLIEKLRPFADGHTVLDVNTHLGLLTLDIIAETAMGVPVDAQLNSKSDFVRAVKDVVEILATRFIRPYLLPPLTFALLAPKMYRRLNNAIRVTHEFTANIIEERRTKLQNSLNETSVNPDDVGLKRRMALLDVLLQSSIQGEPLTNKQICDEVNTFMFEGHDTTNAAVGFCLYRLSRHPEVQQKLFDEIRNYFGDDLNRPITYSDLMQLDYLNCVVKETLRLYPSVPAIGRWLKEELKIDELTIPAGSNVIILLSQLLRDPAVFSDPDEFRPDRYLEENAKMNVFSNIPFSAGPRNCVGQRFALFEMKTIVIKTLRHYELLAMGEEAELCIKITLSSKTGINMGIRNREY